MVSGRSDSSARNSLKRSVVVLSEQGVPITYRRSKPSSASSARSAYTWQGMPMIARRRWPAARAGSSSASSGA